jgi:hypothetical protein
MIFVWWVHQVNQENVALLLTEVYLVLIYVFNIYKTYLHLEYEDLATLYIRTKEISNDRMHYI